MISGPRDLPGAVRVPIFSARGEGGPDGTPASPRKSVTSSAGSRRTTGGLAPNTGDDYSHSAGAVPWSAEVLGHTQPWRCKPYLGCHRRPTMPTTRRRPAATIFAGSLIAAALLPLSSTAAAPSRSGDDRGLGKHDR